MAGFLFEGGLVPSAPAEEVPEQVGTPKKDRKVLGALRRVLIGVAVAVLAAAGITAAVILFELFRG